MGGTPAPDYKKMLKWAFYNGLKGETLSEMKLVKNSGHIKE